MIQLYKTAWDTLRRNIVLIGLIAVVFEFSDFAVDYWGLNATSMLVAHLMVALFLHMAVLFGDTLPLFKSTTNRPMPFGSFIWASSMILIAALALSALAIFAIGQQVGVSAGLWVLCFFMAYYIVMVFIGTSLPAAAAGDRYNPKISLERAGATWRSIAGGLLVGPVLYFAVFIVAAYTLSNAFGIDAADYAFPQNVEIYQIAYGAILQFFGLMVTLLAVVVLCRAYLRVAPPEIIAKLEEARQSSI